MCFKRQQNGRYLHCVTYIVFCFVLFYKYILHGSANVHACAESQAETRHVALKSLSTGGIEHVNKLGHFCLA